MWCLFPSMAQERFTISGTITEEATGETLIGVNVLVLEINAGTISNEYGFYSLTLPEGNYDVTYSSLGYQNKSMTIQLDQDIQVNTSHEFRYRRIGGSGDKSRFRTYQYQGGTNECYDPSAETIKSVPVVRDVVKSLLLLPGVMWGRILGFNVREGLLIKI